ncbi:IS4 family transposase, partial [Nostoc sp. CHAB 5784]|nr:IS4 family transposase [Nostoc mirabile CHAB5784]
MIILPEFYEINLKRELGRAECIKKDAFIEIEPEIWLQLKNSGLSPGVSFFYQGIKYTKTTGF